MSSVDASEVVKSQPESAGRGDVVKMPVLYPGDPGSSPGTDKIFSSNMHLIVQRRLGVPLKDLVKREKYGNYQHGIRSPS